VESGLVSRTIVPMRFVALLFLSAFLAGCSVSDEDRDFYYRGWVNPNNRPASLSNPKPALPTQSPYKSDPLIGN
jgi:hypothetical protein